MANLIERVVGDFGDKRRWRACKARLAATSVLDEITAALRAAQADTLRRLPSGRLVTRAAGTAVPRGRVRFHHRTGCRRFRALAQANRAHE